jgi:hypothetical protein
MMTIYQIVCRHLRASGPCSYESCVAEIQYQTGLPEERAKMGLNDAVQVGVRDKTFELSAGVVEAIYPQILSV